jgi:predicted PurR-regulated permease PerM
MSDSPKNVTVSISTSTIVRILLTCVLVFAFIKLLNIVLIVLTAIVIASFVESATKKLQRFIKNRTLAVFSIYIFTTLIVAGLFTVFVPVYCRKTWQYYSRYKYFKQFSA